MPIFIGFNAKQTRRWVLAIAKTNYSLNSTSLKVMPSEWIERVKQWACEGNYSKLQKAIALIPPEPKNLKIALTDLVENFQFEAILDLISRSNNY